MKPFKFKEFSVLQDRCAMKIGTDGVLLGSWVTVDDNIQSILDIGTGTGVIALMLAQRSQAGIVDALEIDTDAYEQAVENFENSIWADRLFCYHASFQEFFAEIEEQYDLIVSNPPYIGKNEEFKLSKNVIDFEPHLALFSPVEDPNYFYDLIFQFSLIHLKEGGSVYLELNEFNAEKIKEIYLGEFFEDVQILKDIQGADRILYAKRS